jgi:hypothetical protein
MEDGEGVADMGEHPHPLVTGVIEAALT